MNFVYAILELFICLGLEGVCGYNNGVNGKYFNECIFRCWVIDRVKEIRRPRTLLCDTLACLN